MQGRVQNAPGIVIRHVLEHQARLRLIGNLSGINTGECTESLKKAFNGASGNSSPLEGRLMER